MAGATQSTTSSMTSTSHTLTLDPLSRLAFKLGTSGESGRTESAMENLVKVLDAPNRHVFIQPSIEIYDAALDSVKKVLDGVAGGVCDEQAVRLKDRKRKRGDGGIAEGLRIRKVHTEGFEVDQVWGQAQRVIDALRVEAVRELSELEEDAEVTGDEEAKPPQKANGLSKSVRFEDEGSEVGSEIEDPEDEEGEDQEDEDIEMQDDMEEDNEEILEEEEVEAEEIEAEEAEIDMDDLSDSSDEEGQKGQVEKSEYFVEDKNGLNDGFFSIDEFNKQTEFLEQQDATADPYTGEASDEEEIDWDADPMTMNFPPLSISKRAGMKEIKDSDEDDEDEDGPTFGNADLYGSEADTDEEGGMGIGEGKDDPRDNTNDILYRDFYEPPPRKLGKGERQSRYLDRQAHKPKPPLPGDEGVEIERAIADVRRDLFDDNSENGDSEDALSEADPSEPKARRSAHERRQAKLAEEIRRLEAAAVAKREWTLSGEARAADRPLNSLLEEDLDFERTGKPVPVITAEVSESIEELIKRRILAEEFDEVIRRRPGSGNDPSRSRRGILELDDNKGQQSLAEIYEEEHVKAINPDTYMSKADSKLKKEHQEIELLWKDVSAKLDALSSWHYKPKPPTPSLTVVADVATIAMEDVQPSTGSGVAGSSSMLAPQEIYKAGQDKNGIEKGEVVPKSGVPVARQEMTREEKLRRRRREKRRIKKEGGVDGKKLPESRKAKEKKQTMDDLKKGGVKVIGRKGDIRDIEGNMLRASGLANNANSFKL